MKAAYLTAPRRIETREAPPPAPGAPQDVVVRIDAVGVCGSDIHYYTQGGIGAQRVEYPWIMGHECAGTVLEPAPGVPHLRAGDRVAIDPLMACGECDQCLAGRRHTCRYQKFLGVPGQTPGALTERILLPADCCFPVPATMSMPQAVMVEPFSVALHAVRLAALKAPARVAVLGSGPIGLCVMLALEAAFDAASRAAAASANETVDAQRAAAGGLTFYATDLVGARLEAARRAGAAWAGNPRNEDIVGRILEREPAGLDAVFECAGEQETIDQAVALLAPGGAVMLVGIPEADRISFDAHTLRRNELRIANVRRQNQCVADAIELISSGRVNVDPLITHHFPLEETAAAFELVSARRDGVVKAIIDLPEK